MCARANLILFLQNETSVADLCVCTCCGEVELWAGEKRRGNEHDESGGRMGLAAGLSGWRAERKADIYQCPLGPGHAARSQTGFQHLIRGYPEYQFHLPACLSGRGVLTEPDPWQQQCKRKGTNLKTCNNLALPSPFCLLTCQPVFRDLDSGRK